MWPKLNPVCLNSVRLVCVFSSAEGKSKVIVKLLESVGDWGKNGDISHTQLY